MRFSFILSLALIIGFSHPVRAWADEEATLFNQYSSIVEGAEEKDGLTADERKQLFVTASQNPVANLDVVTKYDPQGIIGFCFGRATTVHLTARKMGLKQSSIRKLFIIGDLRSNPARPEWRFHVTTLVKGTDRKWHAVDPIMTPPLASGTDLPVAKWIEIVKKTWDYKNNSILYITSAEAAVPDIRVDSEGPTGEHIIELAFDPNEQDGFKAVKLGGKYDAFQPNAEQEATHFLQPSAEATDNRFEFLKIDVPGLGAVSYNKYFVELLKSFLAPTRSRALAAAAESVQLPKVAPAGNDRCPEKMGGNPRPNLHSFRLGSRN